VWCGHVQVHLVQTSNLFLKLFEGCTSWKVQCESDFVECTEQIPFYGVVNRLLVIPTDTVKTLNWVDLLNNHTEKATTSLKFSILN
jgi:hypothetical protein